MSPNMLVSMTAFVSASSLVALLFLLRGRKSRLESRLQELSGKTEEETNPPLVQLAQAMLPKIGSPLMPEMGANRTTLQTRLMHAGYYGKEALAIFLGIKMMLILGLTSLGLALGLTGRVPIPLGLLAGVCLGLFANIGPSFWLDRKKVGQQKILRRSLPDALDVLVICLEGGLSLTAALRRVATELSSAHPLLGAELNIVQRGIQLGQTSGDALRHLAGRADMEELRSLASVILQSERLGATPSIRPMKGPAQQLALRIWHDAVKCFTARCKQQR